MWTLKLPDKSDAITNIESAFTYVNGTEKYTVTVKEKKQIQKLYDRYEELNGRAHSDLKGPDLGKYLLDALENSYDEVQGKGRLKELRNRLFLNAGKCPCCGILTADELDHHLPISIYQALAIYSSNIVPYCHICNKRKLASPGTDPDKKFIHAYYDSVPANERFLFATVSVIDKGLKCELEVRRVPGLSDQMIKQMNFMITRVRLRTRLMSELIDMLVPLATYMEDNYTAGGKAAVSLGLRRSGQHQQKKFGLNDWRPAVYEALADCDEFCDGGFVNCLSLERLPVIPVTKYFPS